MRVRLHEVARPRPDLRSPGRQARLERSLVRLHGLLTLTFALFTLLPLGRDGDPPTSEVVLRCLLGALHLGIAVDLQRRGERWSHLGLAAVGAVLSLGPWLGSVPGDITSGLAYSSLALCAARLLRTAWFLLLLGSTGFLGLLVRTAYGVHRTPLGDSVDSWLLTVALTSSAAVFVDSLEDRSRRAEQLDRTARARERELQEGRERAAAADHAVRVLHDDVLGALHLLADAGPEDRGRVAPACARAVAGVEALLSPPDPTTATEVGPRGA